MNDLPLLVVCSHCGHVDQGDAFKVKKAGGQYTGDVKCPKCGEDFELSNNQVLDDAV